MVKFFEIICRCLSVMYNRKQSGIICKQVYIDSETFCKIINVYRKQQRTKNLTLRHSSTDIFPCTDLSVEDCAFFFIPLKNSPEGLVNFPIFHFELVVDDTIMPHLIKCFWYFKKDASNFESHIKRFIYLSRVIDNSWSLNIIKYHFEMFVDGRTKYF